MKKRGNIVLSEVVFLVLVVVFVVILFAFISRQSSNVHLIEEKSAKEIALVIDSAHSGDQIKILMDDVLQKKEEGIDRPIIIDNDKKQIDVKLSSKSGYSYGFFNDVNVGLNIDGGYVTLDIE